MMEWIRFGICAALMLTGLAAMCIAVIGVFRFRFVLNRMHAAGMMDTLGMLACSLSLFAAKGFSLESLKLLLAVAVLWCTSPISSHLIARLVLASENIKEYLEVRR